MLVSQRSRTIRPNAVVFDRNNGAYQVDETAFQESYLERLADTLAVKDGKAYDLTPLKSQNLATTYLAASKLLGFRQAMFLGGQTMAVLACDQDRADADLGRRTALDAKAIESAGETNIPVFTSEKMSVGASTTLSVVISEAFGGSDDSALETFIIGHEMGHIKEDDAIEGLGREYLARRLENTNYAKEAKDALIACKHEIEFRADEYGIAYGLKMGFSKEGLRQATDGLFRLGGTEASDSHPGHAERMTRIDTLLEREALDSF